MRTAVRKGFCPKEIIFKEEVLSKVGPQAKKVIYTLGSRISCMEYTIKGIIEEKSYIVEVFLREESALGLCVARVLKEFIPHSKFGMINKKIECTDIDICDITMLSTMICQSKEGWILNSQERKINSYLLEDEKYLVLIRKKDKIVQVYCCKK